MTVSSSSTPGPASPNFDPPLAEHAADDKLSVTFSNVGYRHRWGNWALHNITHTFKPGTITGLLGRNGSGKSTLLDLAAGMRRPTRGTVSISGMDAIDDPMARSSICLLGTRRGLLERAPLKDSLSLWEATRPRWNRQEAEQYLDLFEVPAKTQPARLSQGQRSALDAVFALACHCPVLLLDEIQLGMDAVVRRAFWNTLLGLYVHERPTIIVSSHEVDDIEDLVEDVVVLQHGGIAAATSADELRAAATAPDAPLASLTDALVDMTGPDHTASATH